MTRSSSTDELLCISSYAASLSGDVCVFCRLVGTVSWCVCVCVCVALRTLPQAPTWVAVRLKKHSVARALHGPFQGKPRTPDPALFDACHRATILSGPWLGWPGESEGEGCVPKLSQDRRLSHSIPRFPQRPSHWRPSVQMRGAVWPWQ